MTRGGLVLTRAVEELLEFPETVYFKTCRNNRCWDQTIFYLRCAVAESFVQVCHGVLNTLLLSPQIVGCVHRTLNHLPSQEVAMSKTETKTVS